MKWEQFKNRFGKSARQQEVDVDMDALWEALEPQVDELNKEEPRRRRFIFWILFAGILIIGARLLLVTNGGEEQDMMAQEEIIENQKVDNIQGDGNSELSNSIFDLEKNSKQLLKKDEIGSGEKLKNNNTITSRNIGKENKRISSLTSQLEGNEKNTSRLKKDSDESKLTSTQNQQSQTNAKSITPEFSNLKAKVSNSEHHRGSEVNNNDELIEINTNSISTKKIVHSKNNKELLRLPIFPLFLPLKEVGKVAIKDFHQTTYERGNDGENKSKDDSSGKNPTDRKDDSDFAFLTDVYGGASFINRSLSAKGDFANVLLQNRKEYETPLEASHYGISLGVEYKNKFRLSTGIQQTVISERFDFNETLTTVDSVLGVQILRLNFDGDTIPIMGNIPRTTTIASQLKVYNTYKMIDIPVTIGYHHTFKEKWKVGVQAGVLVNLSLKTKGGIPDETLQEVDLKTNQNNIFKSQVGLNYHFGLSIGRSFLNKLELNFSPTVRFYSNDFSVQDYGISQKYTLVGGDLILRYRF